MHNAYSTYRLSRMTSRTALRSRENWRRNANPLRAHVSSSAVRVVAAAQRSFSATDASNRRTFPTHAARFNRPAQVAASALLSSLADGLGLPLFRWRTKYAVLSRPYRALFLWTGACLRRRATVPACDAGRTDWRRRCPHRRRPRTCPSSLCVPLQSQVRPPLSMAPSRACRSS